MRKIAEAKRREEAEKRKLIEEENKRKQIEYFYPTTLEQSTGRRLYFFGEPQRFLDYGI